MIRTNETEIIEFFQEAAMSHPSVEWFDVGYNDFLFDSQRNIEFPCVFLQSRGVTNGDLRLTSAFTLYCLDLPRMEYQVNNEAYEYQDQFVTARDTTLSIINYILGEVRGPNRQKFSLRRVSNAIPDSGQLDGATGYRIDVEIEYDSILNDATVMFGNPTVTIGMHPASADQNSGDITLTATTENFATTPTLVWSSTDGGVIDSATGVVDDGTVGTFNYVVTATAGDETATDTATITWNAVSAGLRSLTFDETSLVVNGSGTTLNINVIGDVGTTFNLALVSVTPAGWITAGDLGAMSGTIPASGTFETTITIPAVTMTVDRTAAITATNTVDTTNVVTSGTFRQMHTQAADGDLRVATNSVIVGSDATITAEVTAGNDFPVAVELFDTDPRTGTPTALQTGSITMIGTHTFTAIDTTGFMEGDHNYFVRFSDQDGDVIVETVTITIAATTTFFGGFPTCDGGQLYGNRYDFSFNTLEDISTRTYQLTIANTGDGSVISTTNGSVNSEIGHNRVNGTVPTASLPSSDGTYTFTLLRTDTSPNSVIAQSQLTYNTSAISSYDEICLNAAVIDRVNRFVVLFNGAAASSTVMRNLIGTYGLEYITGHVDQSAFDGSQSSFTTSSDSGIFNNAIAAADTLSGIPDDLGFAATSGEWTVRPFITDSSSSNRMTGPITHITIP